MNLPMNQKCPICEEGNLSEISYSETLQFRGEALCVDGLHASICGACGETSMSLDQVKANGRVIAAAKAFAADEARDIKSKLIGQQVKCVREVLGLTQPEAARVFGGGFNAFSKYERGETQQSLSMDRLLRVSEAVPEAATWLLMHAGLGDHSLVKYAGAFAASSTGWSSVAVVDCSDRFKALRSCTTLPLDESYFDSPEWKDAPLSACG